MEIWQAIVLGLTQGLTEFLPVSSSGHLVFLQRILNVNIGDAEMFFNILLHLGTLIAVCVVFWKDIINLFKKPFKTLLYLVLATIPAGVAGLLLDDIIDDYVVQSASVGIILAVLFCVTASVLFATEVYAKKISKKQEGDMSENPAAAKEFAQRAEMASINLKTSLSMGFAQAVALLPGISRSGSTICAGTFAGGSREDVAHFSFLMSIPVILGSFVVSLFKGIKDGTLAQSVQAAGPNVGWCMAVGLIVSAIAGLFAIKVMLAAIKKANYKWFSLYLVALAIACVVLHCLGMFA
ncbi:MAG: undecaprenyl-diphosphate phosphatase [Candidatus Coproplasma sp.]